LRAGAGGTKSLEDLFLELVDGERAAMPAMDWLAR
jgi:hypothetical protein